MHKGGEEGAEGEGGAAPATMQFDSDRPLLTHCPPAPNQLSLCLPSLRAGAPREPPPPPPASVLRGAAVRVLLSKQYRLRLVTSTRLAPDGQLLLELNVRRVGWGGGAEHACVCVGGGMCMRACGCVGGGCVCACEAGRGCA